jgi:ABC-2 type transport system permease protein
MTRALLMETYGELMKLVRMPAYAIPVLLFPTMFYALFGLSFGGPDQATYLIGSYAAFGVIGAALFGLGVGVAVERAQGWLTLKRASPMPAAAYFGAKVTISMLFGAIITVLLGTLGVWFGGVDLSLAQWGLLLITMALGTAPFCAMGCALAYLVGPNSAPAGETSLLVHAAVLAAITIVFMSIAVWLYRRDEGVTFG